MFQGTLNEWILVNGILFFLLDILGYSNYYIPEDQKAKAEKHKKRKEKKAGGDRHIIVVSDLHLGLPAYLLSEALAIVLSCVYFAVYLFGRVIYAFELGLFCGIICAAFMVALLLLFVFLLVLAPFVGETWAERKTKDFFRKEYDAIVKDSREEESASD